ncbi:calcium-dependent lipid-binding protein-like [Primulina eburnea]|uniref:calcium-dependent lipid-binding protein-like n=1 Tax=Primulina eburnea TaxID=1245227 RepID=UPI003C6CAD5F
MGLISGMFMGFLFGIALMAGLREMMHYRGRKRITKAADIKLLSSLNRDDLIKICGENFPEWISFPVFEQVKWLNKQLNKMWPFVADAAEAVIKESVEPLLEEYRPPGITSLKFSKLSLGTVAPKIEGIRVQSLKQGQIIMDIDLRWGGDPDISLAVEAALVASIPIQLKDLQVFTVVRAIFQLADEIPCISAVVVALLAEPKPRIDYTLKAVGGSLTAIPGLSDMIDDTVNSIITDMLQWPHRIVVPIGGIPVDTSELELKPVGKVTVTVMKANELKNKELIGKSDPYVVLYVRPLFKVKTKVIENNLNPVWNQTFELIAEDKETQSLIVEVFDKDIGQDKRLGIAKLPLAELEADTAKENELRLLPSLDMLKTKDKKDRGTVTIQINPVCYINPLYALINMMKDRGKVLSRSLKRMSRNVRYGFHPKCNNLHITHLAYADDLLLLSRGDVDSVGLVMKCLNAFGDMAGLRVNLLKSNIYMAGVDDRSKQDILQLTGFAPGTLPFRYLGVPLAAKKLRSSDYCKLVDAVASKINSWPRHSLSYAGSDTTSSTVEWAMSELLRHPDEMLKLKNELKEVIGKNEQVTESDISRLQYLRAVVKETFRVHPAAALLVPHKSQEDTEINGYIIPKNAQILINAWAIGRDSRTWSDSTSFTPERFFEREADFKGQHFELLPFGAGRRICPGWPLASRMVHLMVATLVHNFEWKLDGGLKPEEVDMGEKFGLTLQKSIPLKALPSI